MTNTKANEELEMLIQCCVCKEYSMKGYRDYWLNVDKATELTLQQHPISHTYCSVECLVKTGIDISKAQEIMNNAKNRI